MICVIEKRPFTDGAIEELTVVAEGFGSISEAWVFAHTRPGYCVAHIEGDTAKVYMRCANPDRVEAARKRLTAEEIIVNDKVVSGAVKRPAKKTTPVSFEILE